MNLKTPARHLLGGASTHGDTMRNRANHQDPGGRPGATPQAPTATRREQQEAAFWAALRGAVDVTIELTPVDDGEEPQ